MKTLLAILLAVVVVIECYSAAPVIEATEAQMAAGTAGLPYVVTPRRAPAAGGGTDDQTAEEVPYNNATSGLSADNMQEAADELDNRLDTLTFPALAGEDEVNAAEALSAGDPRSGYGGTTNTRHYLAMTTDVAFASGIGDPLGRTIVHLNPSGGDAAHEATLPATPDYQRTYIHSGASGSVSFVDFSPAIVLDSENEAITVVPAYETDGSPGIWRAFTHYNELPPQTSAQMRTAITDETGTGAAVFAGGAIGAATATTPSAADDDTSVPTTEWVQDEVDSTQTGTHASPSTSNPLAPTWNGPVHTVWYGATGEIDLPAAAGYTGRGIRIYNTGAFTITIDPNGSEVIVRDGNVQTGGVTFTLSSGAGNFVGIISDGTRWITVGYKGTLAVGS